MRRERARAEAARESRLPPAGGLAQERLGRLRAHRFRGGGAPPANSRGEEAHRGRRKRGARPARRRARRRREGGGDARAAGRDGRDADVLDHAGHIERREDRVRRDRHFAALPPGRRRSVQPVL